MPVNTNQVQVGAFFVTVGTRRTRPQLRKVTAINQDNKGRSRVLYVAKSARLHGGRAFAPGSTLANPPLLNTFARDCNRLLNQAEVTNLRSSNIILKNE